MTVVLIVDDSPVDRRLAGGLLEKDREFRVSYASDASDALTQMEASLPDVVLTDLIMTSMDGLELVNQIRRRFPMVPTVLMTSQGNEEIAVDALKRGAASYVPKHALATDLIDTIQNVVEVSSRQRTHSKLMAYMVNHSYSFELENDRSLIAPLVGFLQEGVSQLGICDESEQMRVGIALDEALVNALYHGNLEVGSELREGDGEAYHRLIEQRIHEPPYSGRRVTVHATLSKQQAVFEVVDEGPGFDPKTLPDPTEPANLDRVSGRGILLMRTFMDEVRYNDAGNSVKMTKRKESHIVE